MRSAEARLCGRWFRALRCFGAPSPGPSPRGRGALRSQWCSARPLCRIELPHPDPLPEGEGIPLSVVLRPAAVPPRAPSPGHSVLSGAPPRRCAASSSLTRTLSPRERGTPLLGGAPPGRCAPAGSHSVLSGAPPGRCAASSSLTRARRFSPVLRPPAVPHRAPSPGHSASRRCSARPMCPSAPHSEG
jgi:hypothetical protein